MHGKTASEARQKARQALLNNRVQQIYKQPPKLAKRYPVIMQIPLEDWLRKITNRLKDCFV
jgi:hypothetical protein